ncbi:MAG TPA: dTDP-4-dehydrorhamnose 3,5-epimerase [Bacteroidia bacterium]|nr:dTDP-4-dehydrorhamnose 3,5-epimerase [Bacteroidia bacterium]
MEFQPVTGIEGLVVIRPDRFSDDRGYFMESFNAGRYVEHGIPEQFAQDNQSVSKKNVIRGLHFQHPPFDQGKLVRVVHGKALDVAVDIRKSSPSYGRVFSIELSADNGSMLWIPSGFAHGFAALENNTIFLYKCTRPYNPKSEAGLLYNDKVLGIDWGITNPVVSDKDLRLNHFEDFISPF